MTSYDLDEDHTAHPDWHVDRRPCGFCEVTNCGCPHEPQPTIPANIVLGGDGD